MNDFQPLWALLREHGSSAKRETECAALWASYTPEVQQRVYDAIRSKLEQGKFVHYDPLRAMEENARPPRLQTLSYADYYARYHTTVTKRRIEAGDTRRQQLIFKEVYASLKNQLSHRERKGIGTGSERGQVLTK